MTEEPWNAFSAFLRRRFGCRVHRVALDAGFTCPNRDGVRGVGGCLFCDAGGARAEYQDPVLPISEQMRRGIDRMTARFGAEKFIAYFQAYTNTHAPVDRLRNAWDQAFVDERVVGLAVATRPDCVNDEVVDLLSEYSRQCMTWVELGFLSEDPSVLDACNRCETAGEFEAAARRLKTAGIPVVAHIILGLPRELAKLPTTELAESWLRADGESVHLMNDLAIDGIKIHNLYIVDDAPIANPWRRGQVPLATRETYVHAVCDYLERLRPECLVHRLVGDASAHRLLAPEWMKDKNATLKALRNEFHHRATRQGRRYTHLPA